MELNDVQLSGLQAEAAHRAGREGYLLRLGRLSRNARDVMALPVMKSDHEQSELNREFTAFIALLEALEKDDWKDDEVISNYKRVEWGCNHCHTKFK